VKVSVMSRAEFVLSAVVLVIFAIGIVSPQRADAQDYSALSRAIELYGEGQYDESFEALTVQMDLTNNCAPVYYYRALIRAQSGDFRRAGLSIKAAFRDSSGYYDAYGLLAYIEKKLGNDAEALTAWGVFAEAAGAQYVGGLTLNDIVLPEDYYNELPAVDTVEAQAVTHPETPVQPVRAVEDIAAAVPEESTVPEDAPDADMTADALQTQPQEMPQAEAALAMEAQERSYPMSVVDYIDGGKAAPVEIPVEAEAPMVPLDMHTLTIYGLTVLLIFLLALKALKYILSKRLPAIDIDELVEKASDGSAENTSRNAKNAKKEKKKSGYTEAVELKNERDDLAKEVDRLMNKV